MDKEQLDALRLEELMAIWPANRTPEQQRETLLLSMRVRKRRSRCRRSGSCDPYPINYQRNFFELHTDFNEELQRCIQALNLRYPIVLFHHFNSPRSNLAAMTKPYAFETLRHFFFGGLIKKSKDTTFWKATAKHPDYGYGKRVVNQSVLIVLDDLRIFEDCDVCRGNPYQIERENNDISTAAIIGTTPRRTPFAKFLYSFLSQYIDQDSTALLTYRDISILEKWFSAERSLLHRVSQRGSVREYINEKIIADVENASQLGVLAEITFNDYFHCKFGLYVSFHRETADTLSISFDKSQLISAIRTTIARVRSRRYRVRSKKDTPPPQQWYDAPITPPGQDDSVPDFNNEGELVDEFDDEIEVVDIGSDFNDFEPSLSSGHEKPTDEAINESQSFSGTENLQEIATSNVSVRIRHADSETNGSLERDTWEQAMALVDALENFSADENEPNVNEEQLLDEQERLIDELWMSCDHLDDPKSVAKNDTPNRPVLSQLQTTNVKPLEEIVAYMTEQTNADSSNADSGKAPVKSLVGVSKRKGTCPKKIINVPFKYSADEIEKNRLKNRRINSMLLQHTTLPNIRLPAETSMFKVMSMVSSSNAAQSTAVKST